MTFDRTPTTDSVSKTRAERIVGHFPQGLISLGTMCERSAKLAEEFASLGVPAYDLRLPSNHPVFRSKPPEPDSGEVGGETAQTKNLRLV